MHARPVSLPAAKVSLNSISGWIVVGLIALGYALLFLVNLALPLSAGPFFHYDNYASRIWSWSQYGLAIGALVVLGIYWRRLDARSVAVAVLLGVVSASSIFIRNYSSVDTVQEGIIVILSFLGASALLSGQQNPIISAFRGRPAQLARAALFGIATAIPFAFLNNAFFYLSVGRVQFANPISSGWMALSPGISEEIIFRFFVMSLCVHLLRDETSRKWAVAAGVFLGIVPHSLNHLPDLFLVNPGQAVFMLVATCLLFGLPMALLQLKRNLETAIAFHWFIDFTRFLFGF